MSGWTWQSLIDKRITVTAHCHSCSHSQKLDLVKLCDKFGPDAPAMRADILPKLKCDNCGGTDVDVIYSPDHRPTGELASPYEKAKGR